MGKKIAILQSNYIPWKGYFDIINMVDEFILYDDMQYTKNDWRNRNKIVTQSGIKWITIPIETKGKFFQKIKDAKVVDNKWCMKHWQTIQCNYAKAEFFREYADLFYKLYKECENEEYLSNINYKFIKLICYILEIDTKISWSSEYVLADGKTERLVELVKSAGGDYYLSGPAAKDYIEEKYFREANIKLAWMDYSNYPVYNQLSKEFEHRVSVLDLIFNEGPNATKYMKSFGHI